MPTQNNPSPRLSILSFGAGAIGSYVGGSLALQQHRVVFLERPAIAAQLAQNGLRIEINGEAQKISQPLIADSLESALASDQFDIALFAFKAYDTDSIVEKLGDLRSQLPPLLCLQNGVENEPLLAGALGAEKVIAATVTSAIARRAAGDVVLERLRGVGISAGHPISADLVAAFNQAGLNARLYQDAASMKWSKVLTNLIGNASSAILGLPPAQIFAHPALFELEIRQLREALAVMRRLAIPVTDLPGTPVRLLAFAVQRLPLWLSQPFIQRSVGKGRGEKMPSLFIDLNNRQSKSEVAYLNGAVVRFGERVGTKTPVNQFLTQVLLDLAAGVVPLDKYRGQPDQLIAEFKKFI